jgi:phosphopantothenoylcysteine synthetase/decarboxylase
MNILITAGNTQSPIDRVRCVTNVFTGRTGARIATSAWVRGHTVTLATSNADALPAIPPLPEGSEQRLSVYQYSTFDDLANLLQQFIRGTQYDAIIHTAAVSDYLVAGTYVPADRTFFNARSGEWERRGGPPAMLERDAAGKMRSTEPEMWVRMVRAPKLVDRFRPHWGFRGLLVKFKLEVGLADAALVDAAEAARKQSDADLMVANTLENAAHTAFLGPIDGQYERVPRRELPERLLLRLEHLKRGAP